MANVKSVAHTTLLYGQRAFTDSLECHSCDGFCQLLGSAVHPHYLSFDSIIRFWFSSRDQTSCQNKYYRSLHFRSCHHKLSQGVSVVLSLTISEPRVLFRFRPMQKKNDKLFTPSSHFFKRNQIWEGLNQCGWLWISAFSVAKFSFFISCPFMEHGGITKGRIRGYFLGDSWCDPALMFHSFRPSQLSRKGNLGFRQFLISCSQSLTKWQPMLEDRRMKTKEAGIPS